MDGRESNRSVTSGRLHHQHPQRVKNHTSWQVKKKQRRLQCRSPVLSLFRTERLSVFSFFFFFFKKCSLRGRGCRVGRPVVQSGQSIPVGFLTPGAIKTRWRPGGWGRSWAGRLKSGTGWRSSHPSELALVTRGQRRLEGKRSKLLFRSKKMYIRVLFSVCVKMTENSDTVSGTDLALLLKHYANAWQIFKHDIQHTWRAAPRTQSSCGPCINLGSADCVKLNSCIFAKNKTSTERRRAFKSNLQTPASVSKWTLCLFLIQILIQGDTRCSFSVSWL